VSIRLEVGTEVNNRQERQPKEADFAQMVQDKFQSAFAEVYRRRNQGQKGPDVFVEVDFRDHGTPEDLNGLRRKIMQDRVDVYSPEAFGWTLKDSVLFDQVSYGEIKFTDLPKKLKPYPPAVRKQIRDLHYAHIPVVLIDVPAKHRLKKESDEIWKYNPSFDGDFKQVLDYTRIALGNLANHISRRENYMLSQIMPEKVEEMLKTYPGMVGDKKKINILLSLGSAHAPMPSDFSNHSFTNEGIIRSKFKKSVNEEPVNDELAAKIFLEYFIDKYLSNPYGNSPSYWLTDDSSKLAKFKRIFVGQMNMQDAERIFNYVKRGVEKWGTALFPAEELESLFKDKGLHIPKPKKLDEYLARQMPKISNTSDSTL